MLEDLVAEFGEKGSCEIMFDVFMQIEGAPEKLHRLSFSCMNREAMLSVLRASEELEWLSKFIHLDVKKNKCYIITLVNDSLALADYLGIPADVEDVPWKDAYRSNYLRAVAVRKAIEAGDLAELEASLAQ